MVRNGKKLIMKTKKLSSGKSLWFKESQMSYKSTSVLVHNGSIQIPVPPRIKKMQNYKICVTLCVTQMFI